jgi:hypothetical protein
MNMPGFSAEAAIYNSGRQYRMSNLFWRHVKVVVPQWSTESCFDWQCLSWCEEHSQYPETCYWGCQIPCHPDQPEILPPPS